MLAIFPARKRDLDSSSWSATGNETVHCTMQGLRSALSAEMHNIVDLLVMVIVLYSVVDPLFVWLDISTEMSLVLCNLSKSDQLLPLAIWTINISMEYML